MSDSGDLQQVDIKESVEYLQLEERLKLVELDYNQLKKDHDLVHNELKLAKNKLLDQLDSNHQRELSTEINDLENEQDRVFSEADSMVTDLGNKQQQKSTSEIIDSMEMENMMLQKNNLELQEQIVILEKSVQTLTEEKKQTVSDQTDDNDVSELHQQIASYQEDVQQFDDIKADLLSEKEALEGILVELRGSLKEKESKLKEVNIQLQKQDAEIELLNKEKIQLEESLNESKLELSQTEFVTTTLTMEKEELQKSLDQSKQGLVGNDEGKQLKDELEQKIQELGELSAEKSELETSLEELDSQHQEAMNQVISIRNDLSGKVENLQTKVQELSNTEEKLTEQIKNMQSQIQDMTEERDGFIEKVHNQKSELQSLTEERNRLAEKAEGQESQIQNLTELRDQLVDDHQNHDTQVQDMTDTVNRLTEQVQRRETQIREANEANDQLKKVQKEWSDSKSDNEKLVNTLKREIIEKDEKIVDFEKDVTTLQRENDEKNELLKSLEQMRNELVQLSQKEMDQFVQDVEDKNNIIISLERQIEEKDESIKTVEEKYNFVNEKLQQGSEAETNDFLQRISDLENTLSEKEQFVNTLKSQIHDLTIEKEKVEAVVNQFNEERENCDKKFNEMKEKFNNGETTINNLHMDIKEMKESLSQSVDEINDKTQKIKLLREENNSFQQNLEMVRNENDTLKQTLDSMKNDSEKLTLSEEIIKLKVDLETKTTELTSVSEKCSQMTDLEKETQKQLKDQRKIIDEKEKEINQYKEDILSLNTDIEEFKEEFSIQKKELEERVRDLTTENLFLENNVKHHQDTLDEKEKYYKNIIEELQKGSNLNEAVSEKNKNLLNLNVEKDSEIRNLNEEINHLKSLLSEGERLSAISSVDFTAKVQTITDLKQDVDDLSTENELFQTKFQEQKALIEDLENVREKLKAEIKNLTSELENVSAEYNAAMETISKLEENVKSYQNTIEDQKSGIILLNEKCHGHLQNVKDKESQIVNQEGMLAVFRHASVEKDEQIEFLNKRMKRAVSLIEGDKHHLLEMEDVRPNFFLPALEYPEKGSLEQGEKQQEEIIKASSASKLESSEDFDENETRDVLKDIENLQSLLKQKDEVINDLQRNNASLLKMMENKSMTNNDKAVVDIHRLENEVRNLKIEREQIMAVMNEKSREASSLKSEVHRLMNTVAAEKSAIDKLQKDMIQGPGSDEKDDMQKQALQNLSRLVRDKDLEIEALKQKNETLLAVLQDSSSNGSELGALMQDKENLARQLKVFQDERDQMVTFVNQKHEESLKYHQEVQRLTQYINTEAEKHSRIQQEYASLAPQFEDKKQALLKAQNEFINYKQKYTELEVKYGEMIQKVNTSDTIDIASYNAQSEDLKHTQEKLKEMNESLQELEQKVTLLHQQNVEYEEELLKRDAEVNSMKKHIDALTFQLQGVKGELSDLKQEHSLSEKETSEHVSHLQMLKESNNRLTLELQDREFEIKSLKEKMQTLTSVVDGQRDEEGQLKKLLQENESVMAQVKELQQERHQTIMALKQRQIETQELQRECQKLKDKEIKYVKELDRLRAHLLQMEDAYTKDALESEEREKDLRNRLASAEEKLLSSTSAVQTASQNAVQQVESLQQQLYTVASQRDQAYLQLSSLQDQCQQYSVSLSNLQLVLEQFQIGKDSQVSSEVEKYQRENEKLHHSVTELSSELQVVKEKLTEAEDGLEAAARLHQQLDKCDQTISALKEEVQIREASLKNAEVEISDLRNSKDSKVDKMIMKSIVLGYFTAPKNKQDDVLHTIGSVLNFTPSEFDKVMGSKGPVGWMPGFLRFGGNKAVTPPTTPTRRHTMTSGDNPDKSFSELFVRFLETESSPKQPVMRLPAEEMALDVQRHHKPVFNPFTAPRHVNHEERTTRDEHLLMPSSPLSSSLPVFSPVTESSRQKTSSSAILNDVLTSS